MEKVFETKEGIALYFDEDKYTYQSENIDAVKTALNIDILNYQIDPKGAAMAHNLLVIMEDMDRMAS
jgi:hypothetical protein